MKKKIIATTSLIGILLMNSGCSKTEPKPVVVKEIHIEKTQEVLVPHEDYVKKAVAILIKKIKKLEMSNDEIVKKINAKEVQKTSEIKVIEMPTIYDSTIKEFSQTDKSKD